MEAPGEVKVVTVYKCPDRRGKADLCQTWAAVKYSFWTKSSTLLLNLMETKLLPYWLGIWLCEILMNRVQWCGVCLLWTTRQCSALPFTSPPYLAAASGTELSSRRRQCSQMTWLRDKTFRSHELACLWMMAQGHQTMPPPSASMSFSVPQWWGQSPQ